VVIRFTGRGRSRWIVLGAVAAAAALVLSGCGGGSSGNDAQTVSVEWGEPENPLIPGSTNEENGGDAVDALFAGLVKYDPKTGQPSNEQAQSIATTDNRTFTITIKPGWTFHDGTPVTAQSYVDAWNWTAFGPNGAQDQTFMEKIEGYDQVSPSNATVKTMSGLKVVNPTTFTVTLTKPFTIFPVTLGYTAYDPMPQKFFTDRAGYEAAPVGDGAFKFDSRTPNQELDLVRYDQYQGDDKPQVQRLQFKVYSDLNTAYQDVVSGNLDHVRQIPSSALAGGRYKQDLGAGAGTVPGLVTTDLAFPLYDPRFQNPLLRKAFSMAIDRKAIIDQLFNGLYTPADGYTTPSVQGYVPNQCGEACTFNPTAAKALLAQAGGIQGPVTLVANSDGGNDEWMQAITNQLRQNLGIDVRYAPVPTFQEARKLANAQQYAGPFRAAWQGDYPNIETFLTQLYRTGASSNDSKYSNPAFDAAMDAADGAPTVEAADQAYAQAEKIALNDMPSIPLWSRPVIWGNGARLSDGVQNPLNRLVTSSFQLKPQG
jgi:oligopeptide transport system substrate-binding protein